MVYGFVSTNTESAFEGGELIDNSSLVYLISGFLLIIGAWAMYDASGKKKKHIEKHETHIHEKKPENTQQEKKQEPTPKHEHKQQEN